MMSDGRPVLLAHNCASVSDDEKHSSRCLQQDRGVDLDHQFAGRFQVDVTPPRT